MFATSYPHRRLALGASVVVSGALVMLTCGEKRVGLRAAPLLISVTADTVVVRAGNSVGTSINIQRRPGFVVPVTLSASGLPAGVSLSFAIDRLSGANVGTPIRLVTDRDATPGVYQVTVVARGHGMSDEFTTLMVRIDSDVDASARRQLDSRARRVWRSAAVNIAPPNHG